MTRHKATLARGWASRECPSGDGDESLGRNGAVRVRREFVQGNREQDSSQRWQCHGWRQWTPPKARKPAQRLGGNPSQCKWFKMEQSPESLWNLQPLKCWKLGWRNNWATAMDWASKWVRLQSWLCPGLGHWSRCPMVSIPIPCGSVMQIWTCCSGAGVCLCALAEHRNCPRTGPVLPEPPRDQAGEGGSSSRPGWDKAVPTACQLPSAELHPTPDGLHSEP